MNAERVSAEASAKADTLRRVSPKNFKMPRRKAVELHTKRPAMKHRRFTIGLVSTSGLALLLFVLATSGPASANHSFLLTVQQLKAGLDKAAGKGTSPTAKGFFLVDVRSPEEHVTGVIPGTDLNIEYTEIKRRHREIGAKPDDHIVVYCQSGHRSNIAAETLADLGYKHVYNVRGSMNAWVAAGYSVDPPDR
jgi:rhodanese-related sulfurtransferase